MAFDLNAIVKNNYIELGIAGIGGLLWILLFPKSTSIFGPAIGVPIQWGATLLALGLAGYGFFLNSQSHLARTYYTIPGMPGHQMNYPHSGLPQIHGQGNHYGYGKHLPHGMSMQ